MDLSYLNEDTAENLVDKCAEKVKKDGIVWRIAMYRVAQNYVETHRSSSFSFGDQLSMVMSDMGKISAKRSASKREASKK